MTAAASSSQSAGSAPLDAIAATALEELQFLARQRRAALRSTEFSRDDLTRFEERMAAHIDVLVSRGPATIDWLLAMLEEADSSDAAYGIGIALLEATDPRAADRLLARLATGEPEPVACGLQEALRRGPIERVQPRLREWLVSGTSRQAASAAEALAFHRLIDKDAPQLARLQKDSDPIVCRAAWRAMALAD